VRWEEGGTSGWGEERFIAAEFAAVVQRLSHPQGDAFAGAKAEEKVGLLRSVPKNHPGCKLRK